MVVRSKLFVYLLLKQDGRCASCNRTEEEIYELGLRLEIHHKRQDVKFYNSCSNVELLCSECHREQRRSDNLPPVMKPNGFNNNGWRQYKWF